MQIKGKYFPPLTLTNKTFKNNPSSTTLTSHYKHVLLKHVLLKNTKTTTTTIKGKSDSSCNNKITTKN